MYFTFYFKDVIDRFEKMVGHCFCFGRRNNNNKNTTPTNNDDERTSIKPPHIPDSSSSGVKLTAQAKPKLELESHKAESHKAEASNAGSSDAASSNAEAHKGEVQTFTYRELATATNNFRADSCIGEGGFGPVYRGQIGSTGQMIAVKKLNQKGFQGNEEFKVEIIMLSILRHPNIVNLIGYCAEGDQRLLVYEYMRLGSLEYHLHDLAPGVQPLSWNTRMKIAMGAATGLNYLHTSNPPVIYRDMKSSNILLDEEYHPKLSDLGLAKFGPTDDKTHVTTRVMGTHGYCAPEYGATGKLTVKSDIYSFGIVLLELITGRRALEKTWRGKKVLLDWARPMLSDRKDFVKLADPNLNGQFEEHMMRKVVEVALMCIREDARARPDMGEVAVALDYFVSRPYGSNTSKGERREQNKNSTELKELEDKSKSEREKEVAEAKMWGETWRDKKRLNAQKETDPSDRL